MDVQLNGLVAGILSQNGFIMFIVVMIFCNILLQHYLSDHVSSKTIQKIMRKLHLSKQAAEMQVPLRVLLVTAHPDDECMFFSPSIISLVKSSQTQVHVLCLSTGDYYSKGYLRKEELFKSCHILGIPSNNVMIINEKDLPDNPKIEWQSSSISHHVQQYVKRFEINMILTFDEHGISGHGNHKAVFSALSNLQDVPAVFTLETVNILRKYCGVVDVLFSWICSDYILLSDWSAVLQAQRAMCAHHSQLEWFRYLYVIFSRYMAINTLKPVVSGSQER